MSVQAMGWVLDPTEDAGQWSHWPSGTEATLGDCLWAIAECYVDPTPSRSHREVES